MGNFRCSCGFIIPDHTDQLPYKADIYQLVRDQESDSFWDDMLEGIDDFVESLIGGKREEWIGQHFGDRYPRDLLNREVLHDFMVGFFLSRSLGVYQCEQCGRLWIQEAPYGDAYRSFQPEGAWQGTLAVKRRDVKEPDIPS